MPVAAKCFSRFVHASNCCFWKIVVLRSAWLVFDIIKYSSGHICHMVSVLGTRLYAAVSHKPSWQGQYWQWTKGIYWLRSSPPAACQGFSCWSPEERRWNIYCASGRQHIRHTLFEYSTYTAADCCKESALCLSLCKMRCVLGIGHTESDKGSPNNYRWVRCQQDT